MEGQIPEQVKAKRSARLIELGEKNRRAYEESFFGKEVEVLVEEEIGSERKENVDRPHKRVYENCTRVGEKSSELYSKRAN